ncbi:MAG: KOW domain-containing protein [Eubacterium sp.]|jgi:hypothetical protein|nr:KOW domain-containing protein [Eubacterium sp.]
MSIEFAKSLSGHDKNRIYYIWKKEERFAYLVDGKTHTLEKPKKKNEKHYQIVKQIPGFILEPLSKEETLTDAMIYRAVKAYDQSISRRQ